MNYCTTFYSRLHEFPNEVVSALVDAFAVDCIEVNCDQCPMFMPEVYTDENYVTACAMLAILHEQGKRLM